MASNIKIKRSTSNGAPTSGALTAGELAYSYLAGDLTNGGDRLYIGDSAGNSTPITIGGKYFTDKLDHTPGTLTASSAIIVDANKAIDQLIVGNLTASGNTIVSTDTNGDIVFNPDGTGAVSIISSTTKSLGNSAVNTFEVVDTSGAGLFEIKENGDAVISNDLTVNGNTTLGDAATDTVTFTAKVESNILPSEDSLYDLGSTDLRWAEVWSDQTVAGNISITGNTVSSTNTDGNIIFDPNGSGLVSVVSNVTKDNGNDTTNIFQVVDSEQTPLFEVKTNGDAVFGGALTVSAINTNNAALQGTSLTLSGDLVVDGNTTLGDAATDTVTFTAKVDSDILPNTDSTYDIGSTDLRWAEVWSDQTVAGNINITGNTISSVDTDGDIVLAPDGEGVVSVSGVRITNVGLPTALTDAVNKDYVDQVAQGISAKPAVEVATTANLTATYSNGVSGIGATLNLGPAATLTIDGYTGGTEGWNVFDGILVKNQTNAAQNGRYYISQVGDGSTDWILTRCGYCDEASEIPSGFVYVQYGTTQGQTGWVATVENMSTFTVGTDAITWVQFSGAGSYTAGDGLRLDGSVFSIDLVTVPLGGTGVTSIASRGIPYGNDTDAIGVTGESSIDGSFLREDATGAPYWSNVIDGGTY